VVSADEANARHERRELGYRWNEARGALRFWGWIPGEAGGNVALALARGADQAGPDEEGHWEPFPVRGADVLVDSLSRDLADDGDPNRAMLTIDCSTNGDGRSGVTPLGPSRSSSDNRTAGSSPRTERRPSTYESESDFWSRPHDARVPTSTDQVERNARAARA
jgi:hypothetical protein